MEPTSNVNRGWNVVSKDNMNGTTTGELAKCEQQQVGTRKTVRYAGISCGNFKHYLHYLINYNLHLSPGNQWWKINLNNLIAAHPLFLFVI